MKTVLENLKHDCSKPVLVENQFHESKPKKFQFMILSKKLYQPQKLSANIFTIDKSDKVELLGLTIDKKLNVS